MDNLGKLSTVFARKCVARRLDREAAAEFLNRHHRMGDATSRYRYGLFAADAAAGDSPLAVATFSNARTMRDGTRSYEWIRYASRDGIRVVGGMGKLLETFAQDVHPGDVMTYVDASVSDGSSYLELGFEPAGTVVRGSFTNLKFRKRYIQAAPQDQAI